MQGDRRVTPSHVRWRSVQEKCPARPLWSRARRARGRLQPRYFGEPRCHLESAIRRLEQGAKVETRVARHPHIGRVHREAPSRETLTHDVAKSRVEVPEPRGIADADSVRRVCDDEPAFTDLERSDVRYRCEAEIDADSRPGR